VNTSSDSETKLFSVAEANATLPLVRLIVSDASALAADIAQREQRLDSLAEDREQSSKNDLYAEELEEMRGRLNTDKARLKGFVEELTDLGTRPKSLVEGIVDFPSMLDGSEVELCWQMGEDEVAHWHEQFEACTERKPIAAISAP
tara:strand:- start:128 stop:565 length:438 start_codon:yes stop_codon:yes gene_type:complete